MSQVYELVFDGGFLPNEAESYYDSGRSLEMSGDEPGEPESIWDAPDDWAYIEGEVSAYERFWAWLDRYEEQHSRCSGCHHLSQNHHVTGDCADCFNHPEGKGGCGWSNDFDPPYIVGDDSRLRRFLHRFSERFPWMAMYRNTFGTEVPGAGRRTLENTQFYVMQWEVS